MTPHEDSEHMGPTYIEPLLAGKHRVPTSAQSLASSRTSSPMPMPLQRHPHIVPNKLRALDDLTEMSMQTTVLPATTVVTRDSHFLAQVQVHVVDSH